VSSAFSQRHTGPSSGVHDFAEALEIALAKNAGGRVLLRQRVRPRHPGLAALCHELDQRIGDLRGEAASLVHGRDAVGDFHHAIRVWRRAKAASTDDQSVRLVNRPEAVEPGIRRTGHQRPFPLGRDAFGKTHHALG